MYIAYSACNLVGSSSSFPVCQEVVLFHHEEVLWTGAVLLMMMLMMMLDDVLLLVFQDSWLCLFFTHKQTLPLCSKTTEQVSVVIKQPLKVLNIASRKKRRQMMRWMMLHNDNVKRVNRRVSFLL